MTSKRFQIVADIVAKGVEGKTIAVKIGRAVTRPNGELELSFDCLPIGGKARLVPMGKDTHHEG